MKPALLVIAALVAVIAVLNARREYRAHGSLAESGSCRWGRNPQYVGWLLFLLGFTLTGWTWWCLPALLLVAISLHGLVRVEEEHLGRVFGAPYDAFLQRTPRYFFLRHSRTSSSSPSGSLRLISKLRAHSRAKSR